MRSVPRPTLGDLFDIEISSVDMPWLVDSEGGIEFIETNPYDVGLYFRDVLSLWRDVAVESATEVTLLDVHVAAYQNIRRALSFAKRIGNEPAAERLVDDVNSLLCVAASNGLIAAIDFIAADMIKLPAVKWLSLPSPDLGARHAEVTVHVNFQLWRVAAMARRGDYQQAKTLFQTLGLNTRKGSDASILRRALDAGVAHWKIEQLFAEVRDSNEEGMLYLLDQVEDGVIDHWGISMHLSLMGESSVPCASTAQLILAISGNPEMLCNFDAFVSSWEEV